MNVNRNTETVLVTGCNGQLGQCIKLVSSKFINLEFSFKNSNDFDITTRAFVFDFFEKSNIDYVINCAAYTNVEGAEKESKKAFLINAEGVKNVAEACQKYNVKLIHISTDYVFDGTKNIPYTEIDTPNPLNEYGKSKLLGERYIQEIMEEYFIIRTSWLYSRFGKNFYKTILEKSNTKDNLTITTSECGSPTNASDLAVFLLQIIESHSVKYGIYHYSNVGGATWYDFAEEILQVLKKLEKIKLIKTDNYPTFAQRPKYSLLSKKKAEKEFNIEILNWKKSLQVLMLEH